MTNSYSSKCLTNKLIIYTTTYPFKSILFATHTHKPTGATHQKNNKIGTTKAHPWLGAIPFSTVKQPSSLFSFSSSSGSSGLEHRVQVHLIIRSREKKWEQRKHALFTPGLRETAP